MNSTSHFQAFQVSASKHADRTAISSGTGSLTYRELEVAAREVAGALVACGINRGDRIAIWGVNSAEWVVAALGIQAAGAVLVPIGTRLRAREAGGILEGSGARIVFCDAGFGGYDFVAAVQSLSATSVERIVVLDSSVAEMPGVISLTGLRATGSATDPAEIDQRIAGGSGDDLADIIFTSGTTGKPKGVPMTCAQSLLACQAQQDEISRFTPDDVFAVTYPFAHNAGYRAGWQVSFLHGVRVIPVGQFDPGEMLKMIERERVTCLPTVPTIAQALLDHPDRASTDLSSLRVLSTGGTTIPVRLVEDLRGSLGQNTMVQTGYGLTETAGSVTATGPDDPAEVIATTVGRPLSMLEVKILDASGNEVPHGEVGEIAVRGPQVLKAYYNNPEATAEAFTQDGFFLTGDAGSFDEAGNIRITDRIKDMYLVGGFNCYPAEIEGIMLSMPGIRQVAVIGIDDNRLGQVGRAFVVQEGAGNLDEKSVVDWCRNEMANYKVPRSVRFLDALPMNATGKVAKPELRSLA